MTAAAWLTVAVGGLLTYGIRAVFPLLADRTVELPARVRTALSMIPAAALAALVAPPFLAPAGRVEAVSPELAAGIAAALVQWRFRNVPATLAAGFGVLLLLG